MCVRTAAAIGLELLEEELKQPCFVQPDELCVCLIFIVLWIPSRVPPARLHRCIPAAGGECKETQKCCRVWPDELTNGWTDRPTCRAFCTCFVQAGWDTQHSACSLPCELQPLAALFSSKSSLKLRSKQSSSGHGESHQPQCYS